MHRLDTQILKRLRSYNLSRRILFFLRAKVPRIPRNVNLWKDPNYFCLNEKCQNDVYLTGEIFRVI